MILNSSLAAVPWWTAAFAVVTAADVAVWIYAWLLLPPRRRNSVLKIVSLCWFMIPAAVACIFAAHALMAQHISFNTAVFSNTPQADAAVARLMTQPQWRIGPALIRWIPAWGNLGFGFLPLLAVLWAPQDRLGKHFRLAMSIIPLVYIVCFSLMMSG